MAVEKQFNCQGSFDAFYYSAVSRANRFSIDQDTNVRVYGAPGKSCPYTEINDPYGLTTVTE